MARIAKKTQSIFNALFNKHLLVTNTIVGTTLMGAGDALQQGLEIYQSNFTKSFDWSRSGSMLLAGTIFGVAGHYWYIKLEKKFPGTSFLVISKKLAAELLMGIPLGTSFIFSIGMLEGLSAQKSVQEVKDKFPFMYMVECIAWPPIQFLNFYFLHPRYRVLYVSGVMLFWDMFMSYIIHEGRDEINKNKDEESEKKE